MSNVLAIASKELKSYFASPIAYTVMGFFALTFGYFFYALLLFFDRQSLQAAGFGGAPAVNVNEQLIRPVPDARIALLAFVVAAVGAVLAAAWPAKKASDMNPVEALRST